MRILLIKPPIRAFHKLTAGTREVPTGLMYLAHAVRDLPVETRIFDSLLWLPTAMSSLILSCGPSTSRKSARIPSSSI